MTSSGFRTKQPFSPEPELEELLQAWKTLDLSADTELKSGRTNALNLRRPQQVPTSAEAEQATLKPLTADDIEQIRQAAYDEGLSQGKEEGFSQGYAEGREQGWQDGQSQGLAEGRKQGLADIQPELEQQRAELAALFSQLQQPLVALDLQVKQALTELAVAMAKAVINVEVQTNPAIILKALQEATAALPLQTEQMRIQLHPDDLLIIQQHFSAEDIQERQWQLRAEPTVERGGCLVQAEKSSVDRTLSQRLQSSLEHFLHNDSASS